jgi:GH35 family endo-1,4-beta-xylanase
MSRAEKRRMDRTETWFNSLSDEKKKIITDIINEKINSNNNMMTAISDICTVSALDDVLDISISDIRKVIEKTKSYLVDYGEYLEREENGGINMIE